MDEGLTVVRYIKELADRIHSIEGKLGNQTTAEVAVDAVLRRESADGYMAPATLNENSKRPYSSISTDAFQTPAPARGVAEWSSEPRPGQSYPRSAIHPGPPYSAGSLAPQLIGVPSAAATPSRAVPVPDGVPTDLAADQSREIDGAVFDR